jgi:glycosyltransferase involved in cell wall biosynthesis
VRMAMNQPIIDRDEPPLAITVASCFFDSEYRDVDALLARYHAMTGWARALAEAGARSVAVVQRFERDAFVRRDGVDYHLVADRAPPRAAPWFYGSRITRKIRDLHPDVVHVDGLIFPLVVRYLRARLPARTAIVVQDHGGFAVQSASFRSWRGRAFYRFGLGAADSFMFTARDQADPWLRAGVLSRKHAVHEVLESSTDLGSIRLDGKHPLPGRPALLWVGRLDSNKDPLTILAGFEQATATLPSAELTLVYGEDELIAQVKSRIAQSIALRSRVHLRGRLDRTELAAIYAGADLFVLGSHHEVACFSLIEAMSFGLTPVVTNIPAFRAITDGGLIGSLFEPGDAAGFARGIEHMCRGDLAARRRSVLAYFQHELSWSAVGREALAVYRAAATARGALAGRETA